MLRRLNAHPYAQATVFDNGSANKILVSYSTTVAILEDGWLTITGLYSMTTRRHIGAFMNELGFDYQLAKSMYFSNYKFNIFTGEVIPL